MRNLDAQSGQIINIAKVNHPAFGTILISQNLGNNNQKNNINFGSNKSIHINSLSLNQNEYITHYNTKVNNNNPEYSVEKENENENYIEDKDEIIDFFNIDLARKISKNDIKWENNYYDIYNPEISSDFEENYDEDENFGILKSKDINNKNNYVNKNSIYIFNSSTELERYNNKNNNNNNMVSVYNNHKFRNL